MASSAGSIRSFGNCGSHCGARKTRSTSQRSASSRPTPTRSRKSLSADSSYSLAPCWPAAGDDELTPYYGLFVERPDLKGLDRGTKLAQALDERLARLNVEYAAKRESLSHRS